MQHLAIGTGSSTTLLHFKKAKASVIWQVDDFKHLLLQQFGQISFQNFNDLSIFQRYHNDQLFLLSLKVSVVAVKRDTF